jgi:hypothetical protein
MSCTALTADRYHTSWEESRLTQLGVEWEPRPTQPSSIRLIHFGRMLDDTALLKGMFPRSVVLARNVSLPHRVYQLMTDHLS